MLSVVCGDWVSLLDMTTGATSSRKVNSWVVGTGRGEERALSNLGLGGDVEKRERSERGVAAGGEMENLQRGKVDLVRFGGVGRYFVEVVGDVVMGVVVVVVVVPVLERVIEGLRKVS